MNMLLDAGRGAWDELGPLAARAGITSSEAMAVKRHAHRLETRDELEPALEAWRVAVRLTPRDVRAWDGISRCLHGLGRIGEADAVARAAHVLRRR